MKNEMREDLLITREDILLHLCAETADRSDEEDALDPLPTGQTGILPVLLRRLFRRED